ncbi:MAG: hypothetical protein AAF513_12850 [Pseudomonadota bacterium]
MYSVLLFLRTVITITVGFLLWFILSNLLQGDSGGPVPYLALIIPVVAAGAVAGALCCVFSLRDGISMAFTAGSLLALGFLAVRHILFGLPMGPNFLLSLWPLWFPAAYYAGALLFIMLRTQK